MRGYLKLMLLCGIACVLSLPTWANDIHVILDPQPATLGTFNLIQQAGTAYSVTWGSCTQNGVPSNMQGYMACLLFLNETGNPITDLSFTFTAGTAQQGYGAVTCSNLDTALSSNNCGAFASIAPGQLVALDFYGGTAIPNYSAFFLAEDGVSIANLGTWTVDVPEPGVVVLLMFGLAALIGFGSPNRRIANAS
jgi:hypothetical protein